VTSNGAASFGYDVRGRMSSSIGASGTTNYLVDAQGLRVRKSGALGDTIFVYDGSGQLISELAPEGTATKEYIYLGNIPVAVVAQ
jgi:YD repeat-containing protein